MTLLALFKKQISQCDHNVCTCDCSCAPCSTGTDCPPTCATGSSSTAITHTCADGVEVTCYSDCTPDPVSPVGKIPCDHCGYYQASSNTWYRTVGFPAGSDYDSGWVDYEGVEWVRAVAPAWSAGSLTAYLTGSGSSVVCHLPYSSAGYSAAGTILLASGTAAYYVCWCHRVSDGVAVQYNNMSVSPPIFTIPSTGTASGELADGTPVNSFYGALAFNGDVVGIFDTGSSHVQIEYYATGTPTWVISSGGSTYTTAIPCCGSGYSGSEPAGCCQDGWSSTTAGNCCPAAFTYSSDTGNCVWTG
jgi:hypothetical protein